MPDVLSSQNQLLGKISSYRTLIENYPKLSSINNITSKDPLDFIILTSKSLIGGDGLQNAITNVIIEELDDIETEIKTTLKNLLKEKIACNIDPSIINSFFNDGINLTVKDIDIYSILKTKPESDAGKAYYFDTANGFSSTDFNVFLWNAINNGQGDSDSRCNWGDIVKTIFYESNTVSGSTLYNYINIKPNQKYKTLKLNQFNNDLIDSIKLFDKKTVINKIYDDIYGGITYNANKSSDEILLENQINSIINRISQTETDDEVDDSYFSFSNDEYNELQKISQLKHLGIYQYNNDSISGIGVSLTDINKALNDFNSSSTLIEEKNAFSSSIDSIADSMLSSGATNSTINDKNIYNIKFNIVNNIIKSFTATVVSSFMSPKVYMLLAIDNKLLGLENSGSTVDYLKDNKNFTTNVIKSTRDVILKRLLNYALIAAYDLVSQLLIKKSKEKAALYKKSISSLK